MEITSRTRLVLLIGHPVDHSISPQVYNRVFDEMSIDARFLSLDIPPDRFTRIFPSLLDSGLSGNVTAPFKEKACPLIDIPSQDAILAGSSNVFWSRDGISYGDNTDIHGFLEGLPNRFRREIRDSRAIVLGAGGAARSVAIGLIREGISGVVIVNRTVTRSRDLVRFLANQFPGLAARDCGYDELGALRGEEYRFLVNATSCGWKDREMPPIDPAGIEGLEYYYDVIYRDETELMRKCRSLGVDSAGGVEMLVRQGASSMERWFDIDAPLDLMRECALKAMKGP